MPELLAVIVIGLSSWLIRAITRQWDDRQKAGDLKAALVADTATATGRAVLDAQAFSSQASAGTRPSPAARAASVKEWSVAALEVRARPDARTSARPRSTLGSRSKLRQRDAEPRVQTQRSPCSHPAPRFPTTPLGRLQNLYSQFFFGRSAVINDPRRGAPHARRARRAKHPRDELPTVQHNLA
jgi:hypothetical protein